MKTTFRSWSWEYGSLVMIVGGLVLLLGCLLLPQPAPTLLALLAFPYCWFWGYLTCLYQFCPRRGDLPERQAHCARAEEEVELGFDPDDYPTF